MAAGNQASRPYAAAGGSVYAHRTTNSDAFLRDAEAALAVFHQGRGSGRRRGRLHPSALLKRLVLSLDEDIYRAARPYWMVRDEDHDDDRVCGLALAHPAASQLEQLRLSCRSYGFRLRPRIESLSCAATLRLLELKDCDLDPPTSAPSSCLALPSLTDLSLRNCVITEGYLQVLVEAATALANLEMVNVKHKTVEQADSASFTLRLRLRCPTVTALVLDNLDCSWELRDEALANGSIELDMPSLRSFRYHGCSVKLSLTSPTPALEQTDLKIRNFGRKQCQPASRILRSFSSTRALTLDIPCIEDIVAGEEEDGEVILPTFPNLKILVLDGRYKNMNTDTSLAMAMLLGSCPVMSELRLKLNRVWDGCYHQYSKKDPPEVAFKASMDLFNRLAPMDSEQGSNGIGVSCEISELTALSSCTLSCLRKVTLRFEANEVNCFPVQLGKFLAENAMDLEEMHVDDGSQFWTDHVYNNVSRWRADSFRKENLPDTGRLQVYYLLDGYSPRSSKEFI